MKKTPSPPKFTPFNKRDMLTFLSVIAPVLFVLGVSFLMRGFVIYAIEANVYINLGIILGLLFGIILILVRLFGAQKDFRIIERFGYEAMQGAYMKVLLGEPWLRGRYVSHYLTHVANTGGTLSSQLEQTAIENELKALEAEYESRIELPQFLVGFMVAMGLLGTFIGLLETLTGISGMLDGIGGAGGDIQAQFMQLVAELRKPLAGMGIAFSASMFGLVASLVLAIMMTGLRRYISRVISLARNVMYELTEVVHSNEMGGGSGVSLSPADVDKLLAETTKAETAESEKFRGNFIPGRYGAGIDPVMLGRFDVLTKKIDLLLESFAASTENNKKLTDLLGFGPRMKETSEKTLDEIRSLVSAGGEQTKLLQTLVASNSESLRTLAMFVETQRMSEGELTEQMRKLSSISGDVRDAEISCGRHLSEIKDVFAKVSLGKNEDMLGVIAESVGGQTALLETLVEEARMSQDTLAAIHQTLSNEAPPQEEPPAPSV